MSRAAALSKQLYMKRLGSFLRGFKSEGYGVEAGTSSNGSQKASRVLSFGVGSHGALGHTSECLFDAYEPTEVEGIPEDIVGVAAGHYHSLAVTGSGELWAWGRNVEGQLGRGVGQPKERWSHPQKVEGLGGVKVRKAAGSGVVSMTIDAYGSVWTWGKSKRGQLGLGEGVTEAAFPQRIQALAGQQVVQVSLGWGHALACTSEGKLYAWGYCADGRLGFFPKSMQFEEVPNVSGPVENHEEAAMELANLKIQEDLKRESQPLLQWEPHLVDLEGLKAIEVACGFDHSLVLCEKGILLCFGDDTYGQLGRAVGRDCSAQVQGALLNKQVVSVSAGLGHSLAVALDSTHDDPWWFRRIRPAGTAYSWGWNSAFQLGRTTSRKPSMVQGLVENQVLTLAGGRVHSLAVTSQGELWTWGSGKNGRLGLGSFMDEHQPCLVESLEDLKVQQAVCGMDHTLLLVSER